MKKQIIRLITFIDPNNALKINPIHLFFFVVVASPIIMIYWETHPYISRVFAFIIAAQIVLFLLKLSVKEHYAKDIEEVKRSIPDFNLFHIVMFLLIASPVILFVYAVVSALLN